MDGVDEGDVISPLVARALTGDRDAFGRLYSEMLPLVRHVVADNVRDRSDAEDVIQEVFTRAFDRLDTLREPDRFRPWLLSIARRAAIDHRRVRVAGRVVPEPDAGALLPHRGPEPDDAVIIREELAVLAAAQARLGRRDALALDLVGHLGFGPSEVGLVLGVSSGAAKVVVHRARQRLREAIDSALDDPS